ncbi:hypothetical protein K435DRAFT_760868 [Dendrothele bispora CBS 962.96]|uniref:Zn(2)-C6 fungal-type domain-containing protein n=1 Tax=Dendrothele bispora (strain CBS 962.96) TaxID=1314807 RepID=A0A4S8LKE4_DENBC|nr:hypothetical protein K435DRAFT_760868 [Dendrothele bispora CBS 962.96]
MTTDDAEVALKKRRYTNACDECRRRKVKCNSDSMPNKRCSECISLGSECTHTIEKKKRGPKFGSSRLPPLAQSQPITALVKKILSGNAFVLPADPNSTRAILTQLALHIQQLEEQLANRPEELGNPSIPTLKTPESPKPNEETDERDLKALSDDFDRLSVSVSLSQVYKRHFGQSSIEMLLMNALDVGRGVGSDSEPSVLTEWQDIFERHYKRPEFWTNPWVVTQHYTPYHFPDQDLLWKLVDLYFSNHAIFFPLLHRPTFERSLREGLHFRNRDFGNLVLAICALASRFTDDPRVLAVGSNSIHSAGWRWFNQVNLSPGWDVREPVSLYRVQMFCLACYYLNATATHDSAWICAGIGLRFAQERGAHRKEPKPTKPTTVERELWRRAFWMLVVHDALFSSLTGRPRSTSPDDYDLEYPTECDDDYWENEDPNKAFVQPEDKPSRVAFWNHYIKFAEIVGYAHRLIYPIRKPQTKLTRAEWNQRSVMEVDMALKNWLDAVPAHIKWDPDKKDEISFKQSVALYTMYYAYHIQIHRNFIPKHGQPPPLKMPSLAICVNSARSMLHVQYTSSRRYPTIYANLAGAVFTSALVLLVNIWRGIKEGVDLDIQKEMIDVQIYLNILRIWEKSFQGAGRMGDMLRALITISHLDVGFDNVPPVQGQVRDATEYPTSIRSTTADSRPRPENSSHAYSTEWQPESVLNPAQHIFFEQLSQAVYEAPAYDRQFELPLSSHELGELPIHGSFNFHANLHHPGEQQQQQHHNNLQDAQKTYVPRFRNPPSSYMSLSPEIDLRSLSGGGGQSGYAPGLPQGPDLASTSGSGFDSRVYPPTRSPENPTNTFEFSGNHPSPESVSGWSSIDPNADPLFIFGNL